MPLRCFASLLSSQYQSFDASPKYIFLNAVRYDMMLLYNPEAKPRSSFSSFNPSWSLHVEHMHAPACVKRKGSGSEKKKKKRKTFSKTKSVVGESWNLTNKMVTG
jgi:hypothetical protein